jgi:hypothetical protein
MERRRHDGFPGLSDASNRAGVFPFFDDEMSGASTLELDGATLLSSMARPGVFVLHHEERSGRAAGGGTTLAGVPRR